MDDFDLLLHRQVARLLMSWLPALRQVPPARLTGSHPRSSDTFRFAEDDYDEIGLTFGTGLKILDGECLRNVKYGLTPKELKYLQVCGKR